MSKIEIRTRIEGGIHEDVAIGRVVLELEDLKYQDTEKLINMPSNSVNL